MPGLIFAFKYERACPNYKGARLSGFVRAMPGLIFALKYERAGCSTLCHGLNFLQHRDQTSSCHAAYHKSKRKNVSGG